MTHRILAGGRATRFAPGVDRERDTVRRAPIQTARPDTRAEQALGLSAAALLDSDSLWTVLNTITAEAHDEFATSAFGPDGSAVRTKAHARLNAIQEIVARLGAMKENGSIAEAREADEEPDALAGFDD